MKRSREAVEMLESLVMAKYLMLFSQGGGAIKTEQTTTTAAGHPSRVFECKTCNRRFPSFQALGGHRASHKKLRSSSMEEEEVVDPNNINSVKPKVHECTICGLGYATGQALGGHMRKHKAAMTMNNESMAAADHDGPRKAPAVLKRSNSSRRVMGLDLNLTPLENDLEWMFGKLAPKIDFKFTPM